MGYIITKYNDIAITKLEDPLFFNLDLYNGVPSIFYFMTKTYDCWGQWQLYRDKTTKLIDKDNSKNIKRITEIKELLEGYFYIEMQENGYRYNKCSTNDLKLVLELFFKHGGTLERGSPG